MCCTCKRNLAGAEGSDKTLTVWPWFFFLFLVFKVSRQHLAIALNYSLLSLVCDLVAGGPETRLWEVRSWRNRLMTLMSELMHHSVWTWWVCNKTRHSSLESVVLQTSQKDMGFIWKMSCVCLNSTCLPKGLCCGCYTKIICGNTMSISREVAQTNVEDRYQCHQFIWPRQGTLHYCFGVLWLKIDNSDISSPIIG